MRRVRFVHDANCNLVDPQRRARPVCTDLRRARPRSRRRSRRSASTPHGPQVPRCASTRNVILRHRRTSVGRSARCRERLQQRPGLRQGGHRPLGRHGRGARALCTTRAVQISAPELERRRPLHRRERSDVLLRPVSGSPMSFRAILHDPNQRLFDCNHDDYFHTDPPAGNYLAHPLERRPQRVPPPSTPEDQWGFGARGRADDRRLHPGRRAQPELDLYAHTPWRGPATGVYQVTFANLASYGGKVRTPRPPTAVGTVGEHCTPSLPGNANLTPDTTVTVRCFSAAGAPADSAFDAQLHPARPRAARAVRLPVGRGRGRGVLHAQRPPPVQLDRRRRTRSSATRPGDYSVTLPGLASSGGTVKVTAFSAASSYCKAVRLERGRRRRAAVEVLCFNFTGAPADAEVQA